METTTSSHTPAAAPASVPLPRRPGFGMLAISLLVAGVSFAWHYPGNPSGTLVPAVTQVGRWYGVAGGLLFGVAALARVRRPVDGGLTGSSEGWYRVHLVLGALLLALLGLYRGLEVRSEFMLLLQVGVWGAALTGIAAWAGLFHFRSWLIRGKWRPLAWKDLDGERAELLWRLDGTATEPTVRDRAVREARRGLKQLRVGLLWQFPSALTWDGEATHLLGESEIKELSAADRKLLLELHRIEIQRAYQHLLRGWMRFHFIVTLAAVQLIGWHVGLVAVAERIAPR